MSKYYLPVFDRTRFLYNIRNKISFLMMEKEATIGFFFKPYEYTFFKKIRGRNENKMKKTNHMMPTLLNNSENYSFHQRRNNL